MSHSTLWIVFKTRARPLREYRNSWGTAPALWGHLCARYLGLSESGWLTPDKEQQNRLWDLYSDERVPEPIRLAHAFCADRTICPPEHLLNLAAGCRAAATITRMEHPNYVNHWEQIALDLEWIAGRPLRKGALGIALGCTSVSDQWYSYPDGKEPHTIMDLIRPDQPQPAEVLDGSR